MADTQRNDAKSIEAIEKWVDAHWSEFLADLESLVSIDSVEDKGSAAPGKPWGEGPWRALEKAMQIAEHLGFRATNLEGAIAYADIEGASSKQIAVIGHTDVVPAGPGWDFEPFALTRKGEYLVGRGTIDDKAPLLCAMYAMAYCAASCDDAPRYTLRAILGANEETGMGDLDVYHKHCDDPAFLFTPDSNWPLIYGEKGMWQARLESACIEDGNIVEWEGGTVPNAVPGLARALVRVPGDFDESSLASVEGISVKLRDGNASGERMLYIEVHGKSAHASLPEGGVSAINMLAHYVLDNSLAAASERPFLELIAQISDSWRGDTVGLATSDESFGSLTMVAGVAELRGGRFTQTLDIRFPTSTTAEALESTLAELAGRFGAGLQVTNCMKPFLMNPDGPEIEALMSAYKEVTGDEHEPFTIGGGTYARHFSKAVSFGMEKSWQAEEPWVGGMHGPNEAVRESDMKEAVKVYIRAIQNLLELDL